jgi:predicted alpha/beta-hydrolase family hydrolase
MSAGTPDFLFNGRDDADRTIVLAHGAGAAMDSDFMEQMAKGLAAEGLRVARFEFPYMNRRRKEGTRSPPDRAPILLDCWRAVIREFDPSKLVIGGKSLGGRVASMVADEQKVRGLVCLGYPFHPPGKPVGNRLDHMKKIHTPTLICQGERDTFGNHDEVLQYELPSSVRLEWMKDGDHSFKPRKTSGVSLVDNMDKAIKAVAAFAHRC